MLSNLITLRAQYRSRSQYRETVWVKAALPLYTGHRILQQSNPQWAQSITYRAGLVGTFSYNDRSTSGPQKSSIVASL